MVESKHFAWMIDNAWNTYLAQKGRERIVLEENTDISELTKHKLWRNFGLLLKSIIQDMVPFAYKVTHISGLKVTSGNQNKSGQFLGCPGEIEFEQTKRPDIEGCQSHVADQACHRVKSMIHLPRSIVLAINW